MLEAIFVLYFCVGEVTAVILRHRSWQGEAMANPKQLAILKQGVQIWNKWRTDNPDVQINLKAANLGPRATKAKIWQAYFQGKFWTANLSRANLSKVNLEEADLVGADLSGANLLGANLSRADLGIANLRRANLRGARLIETQLGQANLRRANLRGANLTGAKLRGSDLRRANLRAAHLSEADLRRVDLSEADLSEAELSGANLGEARLIGANLRGAKLEEASLIGTVVDKAKISESWVYGINVWDIKGKFDEQQDLAITQDAIIVTSEGYMPVPIITVDNIKVAQFIYLIMNNEEIRDAINTLTSKSVLILGRFSVPGRKEILDALRNKLREYNLLPIVFDFKRPTDKDFTETIKTLAGLCCFVIADVTNPKSSPLELQAMVPDYQIPFVPIIQDGEQPFAMMANLHTKYNWVLEPRSYDSIDTLMKALKPGIIDPALKMHAELRLTKAKEQVIHPLQGFLDKD
jgi:uncharacterized protein YjbI with pentapeptide repeats